MKQTDIAHQSAHGAKLVRWRRWDTAALTGVGAGLCLYVLPLPFAGALRLGFWLTLLSTLLHIYTSSTRPRSWASGVLGAEEEGAGP